MANGQLVSLGRTLFTLVLIIFGFAIMQPIMGASTQQTALGIDPNGFLSVNGNAIVDHAGNTVVLNGVNFNGYEYGLWSGLHMHEEADYSRIASWGFNVVRLPIAWNLIEAQPGKYDTTYLSHVDQDIQWAKKYGVYIILDMHQYGWSSYFTYFDSYHTAGVPSWSVSGYPNTDEGEAQAKADFWNNKGPNGAQPSSTNPSMQDRFAQMWKFVANRYANETTIAGYDLLNEPTVYTMNGTTAFDPLTMRTQTLPAFYDSIIDTIRTVDGNHMIFWEPAGIHPLVITSPIRPNLVYSPHYPGYLKHMTESGYDGNKTGLDESFGNEVTMQSAKWNQPVFVGEWGLSFDAPNATQYILDFADLVNRYSVGGSWWSYGMPGNEMSLLDETRNERASLVQYVVRPYVHDSSNPLFSSSFNSQASKFQVDVKGPGTVTASLPYFYFVSPTVRADGSYQIVSGSESFGSSPSRSATYVIWVGADSSLLTIDNAVSSTQSSISQITNSTTTPYTSTTNTVPSLTQSTTGSTTNSTSLATTQTSTQSSINGVQTVTVTKSPPPTTITNSVTVTQLVTQTQTVTQSLLTSNSVTSSTSSSSSATASSSSTSSSSSKIVSTTSSKTSSTTAKTTPTKIDRGRNEIYYLLPAQDASSWWDSVLLLIIGAWLVLRLPRYWTGSLARLSQLRALSGRTTSRR